LSTLDGVGENADQISKHIEVLSEFEQKYGAFLAAVNKEWAGNGKTWTDSEAAARKREIQMLAVRADRAMKASGVGQIFITHPPAIGGGIKSTDLPSQVFDFDGFGFGSDGMEIQRAILDRIPSQIAGLEMKLEEVKAKGTKPKAEARARQQADATAGHRWPTVIIGRIRHVPPFIGLVADMGGFVVVVGFLGRLVGVW
jgi:hypothetical protein